MNITAGITKLKKLQTFADWKLLLFLVLFLDVKLAVKVVTIVIIYLLQPGFKFGFSLKNSRLPLFYPAVIGIAVIDLVLNHNYDTPNYLPVLLCGIGFWLICILAIHQVKLFVERNDTEVIHNTLLLFFVLNATFSLLNMAAIVWETHAWNPYLYQGQYQKYFISTGDFIKGITFDTSTTNAVINAFGVIYYLSRRQTAMTLVCLAVLLLTGSNFTNIILLGILGCMFIFNTTRYQKSVVVVCLMFVVVFMGKVSPQNNDYVMENIRKVLRLKKPVVVRVPDFIMPIKLRPDSVLNPEERRQKIAALYVDSMDALMAKTGQKHDTLPKTVILTQTGEIITPKPDINGPTYQWLRSTPPEQMQLVDFVNAHKATLPISGKPYHESHTPGKLQGLMQTGNYYKGHPAKVLGGMGIGNFSSKLAFRATGLRFTGGYPAKYAYINPLFMANHLDVYLNYFSKNPELHSLTNSPFSVYDQLLAEYGLPGLLAFALLYFGFFARHYKTLSYGIPLLLFVGAVFFIDYWFEQLSVIVLFELMMFLNIKEGESLIRVKQEKPVLQNITA
jgi:hypothetical protein